MIRIDLTTSSVSVEGDGLDEKFITIRALQEGEVVASAKNQETGEVILESVRNRSGTRLLFEYDIESSGTFEVLSGHREGKQRRFSLRIEYRDHDVIRIVVLQDSTSCPWVIENTLHHFTTGENLLFDLMPQACSVGEGCIRIESDKKGIKLHRPTAWDHILKDDPAESV